MFESENRKSSNQNRKIEIGIIEAEIRIEATQLTRRIVTALALMHVRLQLSCYNLPIYSMTDIHFSLGHPILRYNTA